MSLIVSLIARTSIFDRKMKKSARHMKSFHRDVTMMGRQMRTLTRRVMIAAGITGLGYMIKQTMVSIDSTAKLSDRLGVATEKLIGLQHAASITGTNAETLNKSLEIFTRRLGEMTQGSGEAKRGLDMLGLTAKQLIHISPAEAFGIAADKIKQLGTQAEKTAAAYFLFGRAGSQMLNMLEVGSEGLREFQNEAEKLGLTFSRFDAAQVEAANDALTRARATMTGLFRQITIELAPYIETLANRFTEFATAGKGVGANITNAFEAISLSIVTTAEEVERLIQKLAGLASPVEHMKKLTKSTEEAWKRYRQETGETQAGRYTLGPLYAPVQPKDRALFDRILAEEQANIGIKVLSQESKIRALFENIRKKTKGRQFEGLARKHPFVLAAEELDKAIKERTEQQTAIKESIIDTAAAERAMFRDMKRMTIENYQFRLRTIEDLKQKYIDAGLARAQVEQWSVEQIKKLDIERLRSSANMLDGFRAAAEQMQLEMKTFGDIGHEVAISLQRGFGSAFADVMLNIKDANDALRSLTMSVARVAMTRLGENIYAGISSGLFPQSQTAGTGGGGLFGAGTKITETYPSAQHGGTVLETGLAVIHRGEEFSGQGGGRPAVNLKVIFNNQSGVPLQQEGAPRFDGENWVITVVAKAIDHNISFRRKIANIPR